ncbi:methionine/alanine import family NSS transporter small subunit [Mumia qirimensis]
MSGPAIVMMIVAIVVIWGSLAAAIWNLSTRSPE